MDNLTKEHIVQEARSWIGTPFHHQGRVKGAGVDCVGLVIGIAKHFELSEFDTTNYSHIPDGEVLQALCEEHMVRINLVDLEVGDVLLFRFNERPQHLAIVGDYPYGGFSIIHAYSVAKKVVETRLDEYWNDLIVAAYRLPGV